MRNDLDQYLPLQHPSPEDMESARVVRRWPRTRCSVGAARALLREQLAVWGLGAMADAASVVLSELLTNAVCHAQALAGEEIETCFGREGAELLIEVHDASPAGPEQRNPGPEAPGGRGLILVAALADDWGVRVPGGSGVGKVVWAVLSRPAGSGS